MSTHAPASLHPVHAAGDVPSPRARRPALDVVFLSASGELGGAERALVDLVAGLRQERPALRLGVVVAAPGPLASILAKLGAHVEELPFPPAVAALGDSGRRGVHGMLRVARGILGSAAGLARYALALRRTLARLAPAVVHSNGFKMHVLAAVVRPRDASLVWHLHDYTRSRSVMARAMRALAPRCAVAIANSHSVAADARLLWGAHPPVRTVHNAVDLARFHPEGAALAIDAASGLSPAPAGTVRIGLVATLARWKGHDVFLRAIARLPRGLPVRAYVVGGPVYQTRESQQSLAALRALADTLGIAGMLGFTGFQRDAAAVMRALDVVVHASTEPEPFGLVIAEAMASGRALVLAAAGGALELATPGVSAEVHAPGDEEALAARLRELVEDGARRASMGRSGRAEAEVKFSRVRMAAETASVYAGLGVAAAAAMERA